MKNLFGLLPDPDEAYRNAPQLELDTTLLNNIRKDLTGMSGTQENVARTNNRDAVNASASDARRRVKSGATNSATAMAQMNQVDDRVAEGMAEGERMIQQQDLEIQENAKNRYQQEFARLDNMSNENKLARERAREEAKLARKSIGANIAGTVAGMAIGGVGSAIVSNMAGGEGDPSTIGDLSREPDAVAPAPEMPDVNNESVFDAGNVPDLEAPDVSTFSRLKNGMYEVQAGDTLSEIAKRYGMSVDELQQFNGIDDPNMIQVGQTLNLFSPQ